MSCSVFIFQPCSNSGNPCAFSVFYILDLRCILGQSESELTYTGFSLLLLGKKKGSFEGRYVICFPGVVGLLFSVCYIFLFAKKDRSFLSWVTGGGCSGCCEAMLTC